MTKKYGIWYTVKYYCIIQLLTAAIILFIAKDYITLLFCHAAGITEGSAFCNITQLALSLLLLVGYIVLALSFLLEKSYSYKTGRSYRQDHGKYKRTYRELVDYFHDAEPHKLDTTSFPVQTWHNTKGIVFGTDHGKLITIPSDSECNIAIFGPPGSGKTSGVAIINAMCFDGSVIAVDIKGDLYNYVSQHSKRKIIRFCPDSPDALNESCHFNPFAGIDEMNITDQKLYLDSMATILIPDDSGSEGNYFTSRARKLFQGITFLLLEDNPETNFPDVVHAILSGGSVFDWVTRAMESSCTPAKELLDSFYGNSEKNVSGAYDALTTALTPFSNPLLDELLSDNGKCISINDLEEGCDIYLQISQEHLDAYAPLFTLIIQSFSTAFTKRPDSSTGVKNRPILMLLDEFPQLTFSYKLINSDLSTLRSKSVICMVIQQNMSQLEYRYQQTGARSIIGNCNYQIILGCNDAISAEQFSKTFGSKKVLKISNSESIAKDTTNGRSIQEATEKIYPPEYFGDLPSEEKMIIYFKGKYTECQKLNCYKD